MNEERAMLQKACGELEEHMRSAFLVALEAWQEQHEIEEREAWQAAWNNWTATVEAAAASIKTQTSKKNET